MTVTGSAAAPGPADALVVEARRLLEAGSLAEAADALDRASVLHEQAGDHDRAVACLHLAAATSRLIGDPAALAVRERRADAAAAPDAPGSSLSALVRRHTSVVTGATPVVVGRAPTALLAVAAAAEAGDAEGTAAAAGAARTEALASRDPIAYLASSLALAQLAELAGARVEAYGTLATAWVTLGDLIGVDSGRASVEPALLAMQARWGATEFAAVKAVHDERRRAARSAAQVHDARREGDDA